MIELDINIIRISIAVCMLSIATALDIKNREIHDGLWIIFGVISAVLLFFEPNLQQTLLTIGFSLIVAPFVLLMWRFGLFGGADAFGVIVLASLAPMTTLSEHTVTPFTIVVNSAILSILPLVGNLIKNLIALAKKENIFEGFEESALKKIFAMFIGYRSKNPKYSFSIEQTIGGEKKLDLRLHNSDKEQFCYTKNTWVTLGLPYMVFIFGGFLIQLIYGDIFFNIFNILK
ncbi:MAG: A24 family peptidase C-terminal domain-containing protein [Nitrosopumilaceae archaeon]|nr:A24 family peptidase C-terminal domain-containing protein [Nitrosopumilaceae archaeon]